MNLLFTFPNKHCKWLSGNINKAISQQKLKYVFFVAVFVMSGRFFFQSKKNPERYFFSFLFLDLGSVYLNVIKHSQSFSSCMPNIFLTYMTLNSTSAHKVREHTQQNEKRKQLFCVWYAKPLGVYVEIHISAVRQSLNKYLPVLWKHFWNNASFY